MKRNTNRKLSLNRQTLRNLDLSRASGGLFKTKLLCGSKRCEPKPTEWGASCTPGACDTFIVEVCVTYTQDV